MQFNHSQKAQNNLLGKIWFTIGILVLCRFGSYIPIPGIDSFVLSELFSRNNSGILGMFNMLSGGSLSRMSIFALAIMPYINASIIIHLLTMVYKPLEELKKNGENGRKKIIQITRYLTILLAIIHSYGLSYQLLNLKSDEHLLVIIPPMIFTITSIITLTVGTVFLMWLGEQISVKGIGNGSSLIIFIGIVSGIPGAFFNVFELSRKGSISILIPLAVLIVIFVIISVIVFFEKAIRKILVQYPKRQVGNKVYGGDSNYMPIKINTSGVIPAIFASSILLFPMSILNFYTSDSSNALVQFLSYHLSHGRFLYIVLYILLIISLSFLYTSVIFNAEDVSKNLSKYGAYIPGKRPGLDTASYFDYLLTRLTVIGSIYLAFVCVVPELFVGKYSVPFALGGTSLLIVVNVILDTFNQIQTHMFSARYESLMKKMKVK